MIGTYCKQAKIHLELKEEYTYVINAPNYLYLIKVKDEPFRK
jgi:hypothetical protein